MAFRRQKAINMSEQIPPQDGVSNRVVLPDDSVGFMDGAGNVRVRFGFGSMADAFKVLCALASKFRSIAARVFPEDSFIIILYDVALAICDLGVTTFSQMAKGQPLEDEATAKQVLAGRLTAIITRLES